MKKVSAEYVRLMQRKAQGYVGLPKKDVMKFEYYKDTNSEWRWRLVHQNGNITATSGEGYKNKQDMLDVLENIKEAISAGSVPLVETAS